MLSRVANSIYWLARYLERADNVARFIDVNTHLMLDLSLDKEGAQWYPLIAASGGGAGTRFGVGSAESASRQAS